MYADGGFARAGLAFVTGNNTISATATAGARTNTRTITVPIAVATTYIYDANGNLISDGRRTFVYNGENQLTSVSVAAQWKSDSQYDALMRRRMRKEYVWKNSTCVPQEVHYVYDGMRVIQERDANNLPRVTCFNDPTMTLFAIC